MSITVSARTTVQTTGLDRLIARLSPSAIEVVIDHFLDLILATAYPNVPEESGADRASLKKELQGMAGKVSLGEGITPPYPVYQEMGFHHHGTGQFIQNAALLPAFEQHRAAFVAAILALVKG